MTASGAVIERLAWGSIPWDRLDDYPDRVFSQRPGWLAFLRETQGGEVVVGELRIGGDVHGYVTGLLVRRGGIRILASPMPGMTTPFLGFNLRDPADLPVALRALSSFAFDDLGCLHLEVAQSPLDQIEPADGAFDGYEVQRGQTLVSDLTVSEEELLRRMSQSARRDIRQADKRGLLVAPAAVDGFAERYYDQLRDVFRKQGLKPTYGIERVHQLIENVYPTGDLLLLEARNRAGACAGTGIYAGHGRLAYFWGNASYRTLQCDLPNSAMHWYALRHWKKQRVETFHWAGHSDFKRKHGGTLMDSVSLRQSRYPWVGQLRDAAATSYQFRRALHSRRHGAGTGPGAS
jgi:hypothetical protein